jgi:acyl transferase domain-containing protein
MTAAEATSLDPLQRLLLESSYETIENAGIPFDRFYGSDTSVFAGSFTTDYLETLWRDPESVDMYQCTNSGQSRAMLANRLSYFFNLSGPSVDVDTACSTSLIALHLGCQSIWSGDAKQALVAGASVILSVRFAITTTCALQH